MEDHRVTKQKKKFPDAPAWLVEHVVAYCDKHRNDDYIPFLIRFGMSVLKVSPRIEPVSLS